MLEIQQMLKMIDSSDEEIDVENEDGTHVHVEAYKNDKAINPLSLLE